MKTIARPVQVVICDHSKSIVIEKISKRVRRYLCLYCGEQFESSRKIRRKEDEVE